MRRSFTIVSIVVHSIVITAALIAQVLAVGALPTPHQPLLYDAGSTMPADIQRPRPRGRATAAPGESVNAAPITAPSGIARETGREGEPVVTKSGAVDGIENGTSLTTFDGVGGAGIAPPPPPPAPAIPPMRLHSGMQAPVKVADAAPIYPAIARNARVQGVVILEAVLDTQGRVESVHVLRSIPLLDQAAVDAVRQWRYTPTLLNGQAVPVVMTVTVTFTLQ
jgi:periplasmic protein TonB